MERTQVEAIVDELLVYSALIILDFDQQAVDAMKDWAETRVSAHYASREWAVDAIMRLGDSEKNPAEG